jgi:hypothetical protein
MEENKKLYTTIELCEFLNISRRTASKWRSDKILPCKYMPDGNRGISAFHDIDEVLRSLKKNSSKIRKKIPECQQ